MLSSRHEAFLIPTLRLSAGLCLLGWTWVHLYWEGPYGVLLWSPETFSWFERLGVDWHAFVGSGSNDGIIQRALWWLGVVYLLCAVCAFSVRSRSRRQMAVLFGGSGLLIVLAFAKFLIAQRQIPMFLEYGAQMLSPAVLVLVLKLGVRHRVSVGVAIVGFIATFAGHGCYAVGWLPTPGNFHAMISVILGVEYESANMILRVAGILDFVICIGIFIPRFRTAAAAYGAIWGLVTALARPVAGMSVSLNYWGADQYLQEAVLRAPHFLLPLFLYLLWQKPAETPQAPSAIAGDEGISAR